MVSMPLMRKLTIIVWHLRERLAPAPTQPIPSLMHSTM